MNIQEPVSSATAKVGVAWVGVVIGGVTLSNIALVLTIVFTALQIWKLVRNELRDRRSIREASAERLADWAE